MEALAPLKGPKRRTFTPQRTFTCQPQPMREVRNHRSTNIWRTGNNLPLCYHCRCQGHLLRYCREKRKIFADVSTFRVSNPGWNMDTDSLRNSGDNYSQPISLGFKSSSLYSRHSFSCRQSQSPELAIVALAIYLRQREEKTNSSELCRRWGLNQRQFSDIH